MALLRILRSQFDYETQHRLEAVGALSLVILGIWLLVTPAALSYRYLTELAPLWVSGVFLISVGMLSRIGLWLRLPWLRRVGLFAVIVCRLFLLFAVVWGMAGPSNTVPEHISWVIVSGWAYLRVDKARP